MEHTQAPDSPIKPLNPLHILQDLRWACYLEGMYSDNGEGYQILNAAIVHFLSVEGR